MGTMRQMPEETSKKAQRSDTDIRWNEPECQPVHEGDFNLPENLDSVTRLIPGLFDFAHGADKARRDAFINHLDASLPARTHDIADTIRAAYDAFSLYEAINVTPVLQLDEAALPVSVASWLRDLMAAGQFPDDQGFDSVDAIGKVLHDWVPLHEGNRLLDFNSGLSLFKENIEKFILKRLEGIRLSESTPLILTPPNAQKGLYSVTVHCRTSGYRILSSPAYFLDWTYFGAPSFPVTNSLLPGRYVFGTDSVPGCVLPDGAIFKIPFDFNPQLMRF